MKTKWVILLLSVSALAVFAFSQLPKPSREDRDSGDRDVYVSSSHHKPVARNPASLPSVPILRKTGTDVSLTNYLTLLTKNDREKALAQMTRSTLSGKISNSDLAHIGRHTFEEMKKSPAEALKLIKNFLKTAPLPSGSESAALRAGLLVMASLVSESNESVVQLAIHEIQTQPASPRLAKDQANSEEERNEAFSSDYTETLVSTAFRIVSEKSSSVAVTRDALCEAFKQNPNESLRLRLIRIAFETNPNQKAVFQDALIERGYYSKSQFEKIENERALGDLST